MKLDVELSDVRVASKVK